MKLNKEQLIKLKQTNDLIPSYIHQLEKDKNNNPLCPLCKKPLTYISGSNHIECENCKDKHHKRLIKGYVSLLMYNENLSFKDALSKAFNQLDLHTISINKTEPIMQYNKLDIRQKGTMLYNYRLNNNEFDISKLNSSDPINNPIIFTDMEIGNILYNQLLHSYMEDNKTNLMPFVIGIYHYNYAFNGLSFILHAKNNHQLKIILMFENIKSAKAIKFKLIELLTKYKFTNYLIVEKIKNYDLSIGTFTDFYNKNKDMFGSEIKNICENYHKYYNKPIIDDGSIDLQGE